MRTPTLGNGNRTAPADMGPRDAAVFRTLSRHGFVACIEAIARLCRRYAQEENRIGDLWDFRVAYFSRYVEEERRFLEGKSRHELPRKDYSSLVRK